MHGAIACTYAQPKFETCADLPICGEMFTWHLSTCHPLDTVCTGLIISYLVEFTNFAPFFCRCKNISNHDASIFFLHDDTLELILAGHFRFFLDAFCKYFLYSFFAKFNTTLFCICLSRFAIACVGAGAICRSKVHYHATCAMCQMQTF